MAGEFLTLYLTFLAGFILYTAIHQLTTISIDHIIIILLTILAYYLLIIKSFSNSYSQKQFPN
jgi:hypothetical protein